MDDHVRLIDQRQLPGRLELVEAYDLDQLCHYISDLAVRGAPALGAAGAMGVALAAVAGGDVEAAALQVTATRPTAVNLGWGARRAAAADDPVAEAVAIAVEDVERNRRLGGHGVDVLPQGARVLTHCNAGHLACVGWGTALGVVRSAQDAGKDLFVWVDETRPVLQGARLTAWELMQLNIPCRVIPDVLAGSLLAGGEVDVVIVGADRIARNGDVANKVGTYPLAVLADRHDVPVYVAAPTSTIDPDCPSGSEIIVEQRSGTEVTRFAGMVVTPVGVEGENRAFDVTPADLITGYITEEGVAAEL